MNYFHWLLIHVPAIRAADAWVDPSVPAVLPRHSDHLGVPRPVSFAPAVMEESLSGVTRPLRSLAPGAYRARRLFRFTVDEPQQAEGIRCAPWWEALLALESSLRARDGEAVESADRLFVSRRGARRRLLAAEDDPDFLAVLEELGYQSPSLAGCGLAAQSRIFRGARRVVGPHGSGLANLLFCAPGAAVLELNVTVDGERGPRTHFRRLAERRGLAYAELRIDPSATSGARLAAEIRRWSEAQA
ncbi:MAG: glycosyltransferase 61 family protein [Planctomycetota bacterium]|nr:glycosyltransferase 61 family protein [Planctomycetota bacterium]